MHSFLQKPQHVIADLHCDLLCYLSKDKARTPYDHAARCSIPQLQKGNVKIQTMAIFTETSPKSIESGFAQMEVFKNLPKRFPDVFEFVRELEQLEQLPFTNKIGILPAIENASSFCSENEDLESALARATSYQRRIGKFVYVSLTWNTENRFGGGACTNIGLKPDGQRLIDYLQDHNIAIDFSHASDHLAFDMLNYIDKNKYEIAVLASHSNFRSVANVPRNLPDDLAKEIWRRKGIIGLNLVRPFVGEDSPGNFVRQAGHAFSCGAHEGVCLGADFFFAEDVSPAHRHPGSLYFPAFDNAECYPNLVELWRQGLSSSEILLDKLCYSNLANFLQKRMH